MDILELPQPMFKISCVGFTYCVMQSLRVGYFWYQSKGSGSLKIEKVVTSDSDLPNIPGQHNVTLFFLYPMYSALIPVSYTHLTLPTILLVQISVVAVSLKKKKKQKFQKTRKIHKKNS
eukprot:TRINITY_DN1139_c0_g1_i7.p5 TRINITY_DN1139_c0_g1~~TRINITY_DN1139_c0_g1_i7.p5  ORF type:complete len:119 (+),score=17.80 TRINITY_DN1139_c0_g1_i7:636-992(+)